MWIFTIECAKESSVRFDYFRLVFVFSPRIQFPICFSYSLASGFPSSNSCVIFLLPCELIFRIQGAIAMEWVTPQHEEIDLNCEVSSYANAEL